MSVPQFVAASTQANGGVAMPIYPPNGRAAGDLLVLITGRSATYDGGAVGPDAGWAAHISDGTVRAFTRTATGGVDDDFVLPTYTVGVMLAYRNIDPAAPVDVTATAAGTIEETPATTTSDPGVLLHCWRRLSGATGGFAAPSPTVERGRVNDSSQALFVADESRPTPGATSSRKGGSAYSTDTAVVAVRVGAPTTPTLTAPNGGETVSSTATVAATAASDPAGETVVYDYDVSTDNGATWARIITGGSTSQTHDFSSIGRTGLALVRVQARDPYGTVSGFDQSDSVFSINRAPYAPSLTAPGENSTVNGDVQQRFSWSFADPDTGDSQSAYDLRYRPQGTTSWTVLSANTPNQFRDVAAGTFGVGSYEWQVRTYDAFGYAGPYSASSFFDVADTPPGPTITAPINGSTIPFSSGSVQWSTSEQDAFEVRRVADDGAGAPDETTVYYTSGVTESALTRSHALTFPENGRYEHVQVRTRYQTVWSPWSSVRILVDYSAPLVPSVTVTPTAPSITVDIEQPPRNLVVNSDFETDLSGWVASSGAPTIEHSSARASVGAASMLATSTTTGSMRVAQSGGAYCPVKPGVPFTFAFDVYSVTGDRSVSPQIAFYAADGTTLVQGLTVDPDAETALQGVWTRVESTLTVPAGAALARFFFYAASTAGDEYHFDAVDCFQSDTPRPYQAPTPAVIAVDVERRVAGEPDGGRVAADLPATSSWQYEAAASDQDYEFRATAYGDNGTATVGPWVS